MNDSSIPTPFFFFEEWERFASTLPDNERLLFYMAVSEMGWRGIEPNNLTGRVMAYFETSVKPNLIKQRKDRLRTIARKNQQKRGTKNGR